MLHMIPELTQSMAEEAEKREMEFLPELVVCSGFFLIYLVEELAMALMGGTDTLRTGDCHSDMEMQTEKDR